VETVSARGNAGKASGEARGVFFAVVGWFVVAVVLLVSHGGRLAWCRGALVMVTAPGGRCSP